MSARASLAVAVEIGAVLSSSVGATLRATEAQLGRLSTAMGRLQLRQQSLQQLQQLRQQAQHAAQAWRQAQQQLQQLALQRGQWTSPALQRTQQRIQQLQQRLSAEDLRPAQQERLQQALQRAQQRLAEQQQRLDERYLRHFERLRQQAASAKQQLVQLQQQLREHEQALSSAGLSAQRAAQQHQQLGQALQQLSQRQQALASVQQAQQDNQQRRAELRAQMGDALALGAALYGLLKPAIAFESALADVKKVVDFDHAQQLHEMGQQLLQMSVRIPMTAEGLAQIVAAAGQAGIARQELLRFAEDAAKMGVAFDLSAQQAGAAMTGLRSIFGLTQDEVVRLGDAINHLSNNMDAKAADILAIAARSGSTAKLVGLSGQQLGALAAAMLALKTPPEVAATGINALLLRLATADKQSGKFAQALQALGLDAQQLKQALQRDAQGALLDFLRRLRAAPDVTSTLSDLFGAEYADDIAKLVGSLQLYEQAVELAGQSTAYAGSMQREYEARVDTTANHLQLLHNRLQRLGITLGNALLPGLHAALGVLAAPLDALSALAARFPLLTQLAVGSAAALMGVKIASLALGYAWTFVKGGALSLVAGLQRLQAGLALLRVQALMGAPALATLTAGLGRALTALAAVGTALLANPLTWWVAALAAAGVVLGLLVRKYGQPLLAWLQAVGQGLQQGLQPALQALGQALQPLRPLGQALAWVLQGIGQAISAVGHGIVQLLQPLGLGQQQLQAIAQEGRSVGQVLGAALGAALWTLTAPLRAVASAVQVLGQAWQWLQQVGAALGQQLAQLGAQLHAAARTALGQLMAALAQLPQQMMQLGAQLIEGLIAGLRQRWEAIKASVSGIATAIADTVRGALGIRSPSRVFAEIGAHLMGGLQLGIERAAGLPLATMRGVAAALTGALALAAPAPTLGAAGAAAGTTPEMPAPRVARGPQAPALTAPAAPAAGSVVIHAPITIHAEGRSAQELAQLVRQSVEQLLAQHNRRTAALYD